MSAEQGPGSPDQDDFDRQLRDLTSGVGGAARFTELSAAERAKRADARKTRQATPKKPMNWRNARKARELRRPVTGHGSAGQSRLRRVPAGRGARQGRLQPRKPWARRLRSAGKAIGILVAFAALLFVLHLLGFGPQ